MLSLANDPSENINYTEFFHKNMSLIHLRPRRKSLANDSSEILQQSGVSMIREPPSFLTATEAEAFSDAVE